MREEPKLRRRLEQPVSLVAVLPQLIVADVVAMARFQPRRLHLHLHRRRRPVETATRCITETR